MMDKLFLIMVALAILVLLIGADINRWRRQRRRRDGSSAVVTGARMAMLLAGVFMAALFIIACLIFWIGRLMII